MNGSGHRRILLGGLLALLALLAGCSSPAASPSPTVTPAPLGSATAQSSDTTSWPPGISRLQVTNATLVATNHGRAFAGRPFVRRTTLLIQFSNGTVRAGATHVLRMGSQDSVFRYTETRLGQWADSPGEPAAISIWSDGDPVYRSVRYPNGTLDNDTLPTDRAIRTGGIGRPTGARIELFLEAINAEKVRRPSPEAGTVEITATDITPNLLPLFLNPHGNARLRAVIADSGLVRSLEVSYTFRRGEKTLEFQWQTRFSLAPATVVHRTAPDVATNGTHDGRG